MSHIYRTFAFSLVALSAIGAGCWTALTMAGHRGAAQEVAVAMAVVGVGIALVGVLALLVDEGVEIS